MTAPAAAAAAAAATTTAAAARPAVAGTKAWTQASHAAISWCNKPSSGAQCGVPCSMSKACQNNPSAPFAHDNLVSVLRYNSIFL